MQLAKSVEVSNAGKHIIARTASYCVHLVTKENTVFVYGMKGVSLTTDVLWIYIAQKGDLITLCDFYED